MADRDDAPDATTFATVTQLFRSLSKPAAPLSELLRDLTPCLLQRYSHDHPALTSHHAARQLLTDLISQVADQAPVYAAFLQALLAGEPVSKLARMAADRWGWSESTFYTRYREARELFSRHLLEAEQRCQPTTAAEPQELIIDAADAVITPAPGAPPFTGAEINRLDRHTDWVKAAVFSPDGALIATASDDRKVWIWDAGTLQPLTCLQGFSDAVGAAVFSQDNRWLLTAANNKIAQIWSLATGEERQLLAGHQAIVWSATLSPDNSLALTASADGTARLWDVQTGAEVHCLQGHGDEVYWAGFSPDGRQVATVSKDKSIGIWDVVSGLRQRWLIGHAGEVYCAAFAPNGAQLVSGAQDGALLFWDLSLDTVLQKARRQIQRDPATFTRDERHRFRLASDLEK